MNYFFLILLCLASYLVGSSSVSIFLSKRVLGGDVREHGSGNAGATNMTRVYGWWAGIATLAADVLKGAVMMYLGSRFFGETGLALCGISVITGHCYPVFHGFKGGKGVSVGAAIGFMTDWRVGLCIIAVFLTVAFLKKKVSLASVSAAFSFAVLSVCFSLSAPKIVLAVYTAVMIIYRHKENIRRLLNGTEPDFKAKK